MEDTHVLEITDAGILAAVFDGHCGKEVAEMCAELFPKTFAAQRSLGQSPAEALKWTLAGLHAQSVGMPSGACVAAAYVTSEAVTVANLGDAHAVLVGKDWAIQLTEDHRLSNPAELARVYEFGTPIQKPYYYTIQNGAPAGLMPTRTIGDHGMTAAGCSAEPYIHTVTARSVGPVTFDGMGWLIVACDGLWDVVEPKDLPKMLDVRIENARAITRYLAQEALDIRHTTDNLTIIAIKL